MSPKVCFFAQGLTKESLRRVEFYNVDLTILESLGLEVEIATHYSALRKSDLYFIWWWTWAFAPLGVAKIFRKPTIITGVFDMWAISGRPRIHQWLMERALVHASANVFVSNMELKEVSARYRCHNPSYLPLVIDTDLYSPGMGSRRGDFLFSLAWLNEGNAERKGIQDSLKAFALVAPANRELRFKIAGKIEANTEKIFELTRSLGIADRVDFLGVISREEKISLLRECAIYLQPSRFEGFGVAVLEAMSVGAPIITSPSGAVPEVVGKIAHFVNASNTMEIAQTIQRILDDTIATKERCRDGVSRAKELFSLDRRREGLRQIITNLTGWSLPHANGSEESPRRAAG